MSGTKNTCEHVVDYNLLAGKSRASNSKQNGSRRDDSKLEMSVEDKYASPVHNKRNNKGENQSGNTQEKDRDTSSKFMVNQSISDNGENNMVSMECNNDDDEIVINKRVRKQIVGNVKDDRTGSMMPVVLEEMVDGTKSKKTGKKKSAISPAWPGMAQIC